jgi:hypothetical protein
MRISPPSDPVELTEREFSEPERDFSGEWLTKRLRGKEK